MSIYAIRKWKIRMLKKVENKANSDASNIIRHADMYVHSVYEL